MLTCLLVILVICMFRYLEKRSLPWLVGTAVTLAFAFLTMEASFIFGGLFGIFLVLALAAQLWASTWPGENGSGRRGSFRMLAGIAVPLLAVGLLLAIFKLRLPGFAVLGIGAVLALLAVVLAVTQWKGGLRAFRELDLIVLLLTLVLPFLSAIVLKALGWQISQFNNPGQITLSMVWQGLLVLAILFVVSVVIGYYWLRERWFVAAGLFWAIELLFFTTFLTNGQGVGTGLIGSLGYWIDQQEVMRGGQPWYYFYLMVPLYEFLPLVLSGIGTIAAVVWLVRYFRGHTAAEAVAVADEAGGEMPSARRRSARRCCGSCGAHLRPGPVRRVPRLLAVGDLGGLHLRGREDALAHGLLRRVDGAAGRLVAGASDRRHRLARAGKASSRSWLMIPLFLSR